MESPTNSCLCFEGAMLGLVQLTLWGLKTHILNDLTKNELLGYGERHLQGTEYRGKPPKNDQSRIGNRSLVCLFLLKVILF